MGVMPIQLKAIDILIVTLFLQFLVFATVIFDVPIAREVFGFIYFCFFPGLLFLRSLRLKIGAINYLAFSVGLSIAFLMILGLLVNEFGLVFGISRPFSLINLLIPLSIMTLILSFVSYFRNKDPIFTSLQIPKSSFLLLFLLILSIIGAISAVNFGNNLLLLIMVLAIASLLACAAFLKKISPAFIGIAVLIISISLFYHSSLVSNNMLHFGSDVPGEIFVANSVLKGGFWSSTNPYSSDLTIGRTYDMLSVTILPAILSILLNMNVIWIFKLLYPLFFALIPLALYGLWSKSLGHKYAFFAVFLLMAYQPFYNELLGLNKQIIGSLFLVLLLLVLFSKELSSSKKTLFIVLFSFCLVVSHYALAEIFLIFISVTLIYLLLRKQPLGKITPTCVLLIIVIMFAWYVFTSSSSVFESLVTFGQRVGSQLGDFFNFESRESGVLRGLGLEAPVSIWNWISRLFAYLTEFFIFLGFIGILTKKVKFEIEREKVIFIFISMAFLAALILIPGLSSTMGITRFYQILLIFIAPLFVLGIAFLSRIIHKQRQLLVTSILVIIVLVPYFLFQTGFVYEVTQNTSWSMSLSGYRMDADRLYREFGYKNDSVISGIRWMSNNMGAKHVTLYADEYSYLDQLMAYSDFYVGGVKILSNTTQVNMASLIYLNPSNTLGGTFVGDYYVYNTSDNRFLNDINKIYSNNGNEIFGFLI